LPWSDSSKSFSKQGQAISIAILDFLFGGALLLSLL
jgi:hypothetical protein